MRALARRLLPPIVADLLRYARGRLAGPPAERVWSTVRDGVLGGHELWLPDEPAGWAAAMRAGAYEPAFAAALAGAVRPGDVCYDLGAHIGYYTLLMARIAGPDGVVHAFEPH